MAHTENDVWFVLGGARSGKSRRALALAEMARRRVFLATAEASDREMAERIDRHRAERGAGWTTIEEPLAVADVVRREGRGDTAIVIDCLTLWLGNLLQAGRDVEPETSALAEALAGARGRIVLVSNEIGLGLVPDTALGRGFRDAQGRLNQRIAAIATHVELVVAGLPLTLADRSSHAAFSNAAAVPLRAPDGEE